MNFLSSIFFFFFVFTLLNPFSAKAEADRIFINEIAWMGSENSANDEWIELYNDSGQSKDLTGWILKTTDQGLKIELKGKIPGKGFYLLERSDDLTIKEIPASQIYKGSLGNNGEMLELYSKTGELIESFDYGQGWPEGDNLSKKTMERISFTDRSPGSWQTSQIPGGTPKAANSPPEIKVNPSLLQTTAQNIQNPFPLSAGFSVSLFSGLLVVFLKSSLKKKT